VLYCLVDASEWKAGDPLHDYQIVDFADEVALKNIKGFWIVKGDESPNPYDVVATDVNMPNVNLGTSMLYLYLGQQ